MLIGSNGIELYGLEILSKVIKTPTFSTSKQWNKGAITPVLTSKQFTYGTITLTTLISGDSEDELSINKSNFINDIADTVIKDGNFYYKVTLTSSTENEAFVNILNDKYCEKLAVVLAIDEKYKDEVVENIELIESKFTLDVGGNINTSCVLEITPTQAMVDLVINGVSEYAFTVNNLPINKTLIIDGENQTITIDGVNKFGDTEELWEFPQLAPGINVITFSKSYFTGKIKYKPRYR